MTDIINLPAISRNPGTYNLPSTAIGVSGSAFEIAIGRALLPAGSNIVAISIEGSDDNVTWSGLGGITLDGGVALDKSGGVATESIYRITFPSVKLATYRLRGKAVLNVTITASVRVSVI